MKLAGIVLLYKEVTLSAKAGINQESCCIVYLVLWGYIGMHIQL